MDDAGKVVGVVLDESGAISKFVIEQEDHSTHYIDAPASSTPVNAATMLAADGDNLGAGNILLTTFITDAGDETITVGVDGKIELPSAGSFAFHWTIQATVGGDINVQGDTRLANENPFAVIPASGGTVQITYIHRAEAAGEKVWLTTGGAIDTSAEVSWGQVLVRQIA